MVLVIGGWVGKVLRGPPHAGRAGGLVGLTRCLASGAGRFAVLVAVGADAVFCAGALVVSRYVHL
jgi:hypothetical protein